MMDGAFSNREAKQIPFTPAFHKAPAMMTPQYTRSGMVVIGIMSFIIGYCIATALYGVTWGAVGPLLGAIVGGTISFWATEVQERNRRKNDLADVTASLYVEIADRSARCLGDYLYPWYRYETQSKIELRKENAAWVGKFRPVNPVVYPGVAAKIGLLCADIYSLWCNSIFIWIRFAARLMASQLSSVRSRI